MDEPTTNYNPELPNVDEPTTNTDSELAIVNEPPTNTDLSIVDKPANADLPIVNEPTNAILLGELKKVNEALGKMHKRLKNTENTISGMQSELNVLTKKKQSKVLPTNEVRVSAVASY